MIRILNFVLNAFIMFIFLVQFAWGNVYSNKYVAVSPDNKHFIPVDTEKQKEFYKKQGYKIIKDLIPVGYKHKKQNLFAEIPDWQNCKSEPDDMIIEDENYGYRGMGVPKDKINTFLNRTTAKGEGIKIAIMDGGYDTKHEDLQGQIIKTCLPVYDANSEFHGWHYRCSDNVLPGTFDCNDIDGYHGTTTLGVMAAKEDDDAVTGIAPKAKYMLYDIEDSSALMYAIYDAVDSGANIITVQLTFPSVSPNNTWYNMFYNTIKYAYEHNVIFIASAGNINTASSEHPCVWTVGNGMLFKIGAFKFDPFLEDRVIEGYESPELINYIFNVGEYSNYALKNYPESFTNPDIYADFYAMEMYFPTLMPNNNYNEVHGGTSYSAPIFAGFVADMLSVNPYLTYQDIKEIVSFTMDNRYLYLDVVFICNEDEYVDKSLLPAGFCQSDFPDDTSGYKIRLKNSYTHPVNMYKALSLTSLEFNVNIQNDILTSDIIIPPISHPADVYVWIELPDGSKYYLNYSNDKGLYFVDKEMPIVTDFYYNKVLQYQYFGENGWFAPVSTKYLPKGTYKFCGRYRVNGQWLGYHYCSDFEIK